MDVTKSDERVHHAISLSNHSRDERDEQNGGVVRRGENLPYTKYTLCSLPKVPVTSVTFVTIGISRRIIP